MSRSSFFLAKGAASTKGSSLPGSLPPGCGTPIIPLPRNLARLSRGYGDPKSAPCDYGAGMVSKSRRAKAINVGSREVPAPKSTCGGSRELTAGAKPVSPDTSQAQGSNLPSWIGERHAEASKGIPRQEVARPDGAEEFMTVAEAAAALRISERTIRRHLAAGSIPHFRAGKQIRIPRSTLLKGWSNE